MLKRIANLLEDNAYYIAIILTLAITYLSIFTVKIPKSSFGYFDKIAHVMAYSALSFSWFLTYLPAKFNSLRIFAISILISIFGIIIEIVQEQYTIDREGDLYDIIANTIGIVFGLGIYFLWVQQRKLLK